MSRACGQKARSQCLPATAEYSTPPPAPPPPSSSPPKTSQRPLLLALRCLFLLLHRMAGVRVGSGGWGGGRERGECVEEIGRGERRWRGGGRSLEERGASAERCRRWQRQRRGQSRPKTGQREACSRGGTPASRPSGTGQECRTWNRRRQDGKEFPKPPCYPSLFCVLADPGEQAPSDSIACVPCRKQAD